MQQPAIGIARYEPNGMRALFLLKTRRIADSPMRVARWTRSCYTDQVEKREIRQ